MKGIEAAQALCELGVRLTESSLVAGTWGNISLRVDGGAMAITPSGVPYRELTPEGIPIVFLADGSWTGPKPSSEMKLHAEIYRRREEIGAVIHTHSPSASVVAAARREVPPVLDDMAQIIGPTLRVAPYALPSTRKIVKVTMRALAGRMAALLANHGAVCLGRDGEEAFTCAMVTEKACKAFIEAEFLGGAKSIPRFEAVVMHQYYLRKYSKQGRQ